MVNRLFEAPLALPMGYRYRTDYWEGYVTTDDPNPTGDLSLSAVNIGLLVNC